MLGMFEDVNVQKEPARPVYCEHSFLTCRAPLRGVADANGATATATATTTANPKSNFFICLPLSRATPGRRPQTHEQSSASRRRCLSTAETRRQRERRGGNGGLHGRLHDWLDV